MPVSKHAPRSPLTRIKASNVKLITGKESRPAIFFEVDGFLRFLHPDAERRYKEAGIKPPPGPINVFEQILHPEAVAYLKDRQDEYLLIGFTHQEHVEYLGATEGPERGNEAAHTVATIQRETIDMARQEGLFLTEINVCHHYMNHEQIKGPDPSNPSKEIVLDVKSSPRCPCHFPERKHLKDAINRYNVDISRSVFVYVTEAGRKAAFPDEQQKLVEFSIPELNHTNHIIRGWWRRPKPKEIEVKMAEALKKDIQRGSSSTLEAIANAEFGKTAEVKNIEDAMPNVSNLLAREGLIESKE